MSFPDFGGWLCDMNLSLFLADGLETMGISSAEMCSLISVLCHMFSYRVYIPLLQRRLIEFFVEEEDICAALCKCIFGDR